LYFWRTAEQGDQSALKIRWARADKVSGGSTPSLNPLPTPPPSTSIIHQLRWRVAASM